MYSQSRMSDYCSQSSDWREGCVGDRLVVAEFGQVRGFGDEEAPDKAVALPPDTMLSFDRDVKAEPNFPFLPNFSVHSKVGRTSLINSSRPDLDHDAIIFDNGLVLSLQQICRGQRARVTALPTMSGKRASLP